MNWTPELQTFIRQHIDDDVDRLLLSSSRYPEVDVKEAVSQIVARRQIRYKLPEWYAVSDNLIMGGRVPAEQCSSETTARYKQRLVLGDSLCDLTGGMGVDFYYMSRGLSRAIYIERQPHLVEALRHNLQVLDAVPDTLQSPLYELRSGDFRELGIPNVDTIYLDPARRATNGSRVYDLEECEPNVVALQTELRSHCRKLIVKLSPMADIARVLSQLDGVTDVHIVAVRNECKEVLVEVTNELRVEAPMIHCVDFRASDYISFEYRSNDEADASAICSWNVSGYLYEPDVTLLKAGAFKLMCPRFGVEKLAANTHLYSSDRLVSDFPGRIFKIDDVIPFSSKTIKELGKNRKQANVSVRNFPLTAEQLRHRLKWRDGGDLYLFGTTLHQLGTQLLLCRKIVLLVLFLLLQAPMGVSARRKSPVNTVPTVEMMLSEIKDLSPLLWNHGMPFVHLDTRLSLSLVPEVPLLSADTVSFLKSVWRYDAIVSEEDWMGRQKMQLRFLSPIGRAYRFDTERTMSQIGDTAYLPAIGCLVPLSQVEAADSLLRARTFYILANDERVFVNDSVRLEKFVPVEVDSVTFGTELAPLRVWFTQAGRSASFVATLPTARSYGGAFPIQRYLSVADPRLQYPNIRDEVWKKIRESRIDIDMTMEEVRLSIGRPLRFERIATKSGLVERWFYPNSRVLEFWDNRLLRIGREQ